MTHVKHILKILWKSFWNINWMQCRQGLWFSVWFVLRFWRSIIIIQIQKLWLNCQVYRSSRPEVFCNKILLEISQYSQESTCARVSFLIKLQASDLCQSLFFNKVVGLRPAALLKMRLWHRCFPVNFATFLKTPFLTEHLWWLQAISLANGKISE